MMMPANYSAIAENEMTYVIGGGVIEFLGSFTAPVWDVNNLKTFNTNLITLVGNAFSGKLINNTLGYVFNGEATWTGLVDQAKSLVVTPFNNGIGDGIANIAGLVAAGYNLGRTTVAPSVGGIKMTNATSKEYDYVIKVVNG